MICYFVWLSQLMIIITTIQVGLSPYIQKLSGTNLFPGSRHQTNANFQKNLPRAVSATTSGCEPRMVAYSNERMQNTSGSKSRAVASSNEWLLISRAVANHKWC